MMLGQEKSFTMLDACGATGLLLPSFLTGQDPESTLLLPLLRSQGWPPSACPQDQSGTR